MQTQNNLFTPSQINRLVKGELEMSFPAVWIEGEISNLSKPASGHLYFSLKDSRAQLSCALFKGQRLGLKVQPENGLLVKVRGKLTLYEARGNYQLIANRMELAGTGELQQKFEALKKQLEAEGLFQSQAKQALPERTRKIAVITSASGAAIRDIITILRRRWPLANIRIYPVPVQGDEAAPALVNALAAANRHQWADVIIIGRGGGSLEDLWAFNEESVARAIFASQIPVVSAVGHETDTVISDFVADIRAATPSAAAELLVPDQRDYQASLRQTLQRFQLLQSNQLQALAQQLDGLELRLLARHPEKHLQAQQLQLKILRQRLFQATERGQNETRLRLQQWQQRLARSKPTESILEKMQYTQSLSQRLRQAQLHKLENHQHELAGRARTLNALSPLNTLERGYSITRLGDTIIDRADALKKDDQISIQFASGQVNSTVTKVITESK